MAKCSCYWCTVEHPEYKAILLETDVNALHEYIRKIYEDKCMAEEEACWNKSKVAESQELVKKLCEALGIRQL